MISGMQVCLTDELRRKQSASVVLSVDEHPKTLIISSGVHDRSRVV